MVLTVDFPQLLKKYDTGHQGTLGQKELGDLLQDLNKGDRPSDEEILWVLRVADSKSKDLDDRIGADELEAAIDTWVGYQKNMPLIKDVFKRYDTNRSGKLERDELSAVLTELNEGVHPTAQEIDLVMNTADGMVSEPTGGINPTGTLSTPARLECIHYIQLGYQWLRYCLVI